MSRINCHSAFRHYEMFHGHGACHGGSSYGSIFNTTYNINCGGHHGGFWGGFGLGLGNFFGNMLGGFMGNMGFPGMGGYNMGLFGGMGFPFFGGGSWFGGGNSNRVSDSNSSSGSCKCKGCGNDNDKTKEVVKDDPDCAKIADLAQKANEANDKNAIEGLIQDIDKAINELDDNNKDAQTKTLNELKKGLDAKKTGLDKNKTPEEDKDCAVINELSGKVNNLPDNASQDEINKLLGEIDIAIKNLDEYNYDKQKGTLENLKGILNSKKTKKPVNNNGNQSNSNSNTTPVSNVDTNNKTYNGAIHTNVAENDVETALKSLKDIIDTSNIADFENVTVQNVEKNSQGKWRVTVKSKSGKIITYTEIGKTKDGGIVFHGKHDDQHYVLQKATINNKERIRLMQYENMSGWQIADVH